MFDQKEMFSGYRKQHNRITADVSVVKEVIDAKKKTKKTFNLEP